MDFENCEDLTNTLEAVLNKLLDFNDEYLYNINVYCNIANKIKKRKRGEKKKIEKIKLNENNNKIITITIDDDIRDCELDSRNEAEYEFRKK